MRLLLLTPPMTQVNTPYPATAYLTGFLRERGHDARQEDPALELLLRLLSRDGLAEIRDALKNRQGKKPASVRHFLYAYAAYEATVDSVIRFLQGKDDMLAHRLVSGEFVPRGPRFASLDEMEEGDGSQWAFGTLGIRDRARHIASLYVDDLVDVIRDGIDERFELSRYAEKLASSAPSFDPILAALAGETLVDRHLDDLTRAWMKKHEPDVVGLTVPFPGNVYGAFRIAQLVRKEFPKTKIVMGGGYVNTELRELSDGRVFDFVDYITLDDGEGPLLRLIEKLSGVSPEKGYLRTLMREGGKVVFRTNPALPDISFRDSGTPTYGGLPLGRYLSLCEFLNPMHRLWSDGRWNKLTLAHGCYWKKCTFCDVSLDYIGRYEPENADRLVDRIVKLVEETGESGFHFVDEAAPPKLLSSLADRLLERKVTITWWANIRFEKTFTPELARKLAASGCIAVSGGLEVASDRLLKLMKKGVTVEQVARVTHAFTEAGIMVHSYLMYGFPTQTVQETVDSLERVRQLFAAGCLQSAFWHRFTATIHSPVGKNPGEYGIELLPKPSTFARNEVAFLDPVGADHDGLHPGLKKALYNYMHGVGLEEDVRGWFDFPVPKARVSAKLIESALQPPRVARAHSKKR